MILAEDYESLLQNLGIEYFVQDIRFVPDLSSRRMQRNAAYGLFTRPSNNERRFYGLLR